MFRRRTSSIFLAVVLVVMVLGGGLLHALVPHDHGNGDEHGGTAGESIIWQIFHSALKHDDKKALFAMVEPLVLFLFAVILLKTLNTLNPILDTREFFDPRVHDAVRTSALRRGIFPYRAFG